MPGLPNFLLPGKGVSKAPTKGCYMVTAVVMSTNVFEREAASGTTLRASLDDLTHCRGPKKWEGRVYSQKGTNWIPAGRATSQDTRSLGLSSLCKGALTHIAHRVSTPIREPCTGQQRRPWCSRLQGTCCILPSIYWAPTAYWPAFTGLLLHTDPQKGEVTCQVTREISVELQCEPSLKPWS